MSAPNRIMPDDAVDPVGGTPPVHPVEPHHRREPLPPGHHRRLYGTVTAVHKRTPRHEEGHLLDATVGAQVYDEIVVRIDSGDPGDLAGTAVAIVVMEQD